jgi:hypothetical protein
MRKQSKLRILRAALAGAFSLLFMALAAACSNSAMPPYGGMNNYSGPPPPGGGPPFTVTYINTTVNTTGGVPVDATPYASGATVTVKGNTGNLSWPPFAFTGWNTMDYGSDGGGGGGTFYSPGATFTITANIYLFGTWNP